MARAVDVGGNASILLNGFVEKTIDLVPQFKREGEK